MRRHSNDRFLVGLKSENFNPPKLFENKIHNINK